MTATALNFHHLHYFWAVAHDGNLTRTAARLRVSQSALSAQIRQLEASLGQSLFHREGRRLAITEAGRIALAYADDIFATGSQLVATLEDGRAGDVLRIGAVATLSRNFQESFVKPLLGDARVQLRLETARLDELLDRLEHHALDLVLSNQPPQVDGRRPWRCRRLAKQPVSLIGHARHRRFRFPEDLNGATMVLPGPDSVIRSEFDALCEQLGVRVRAVAEVDDMATMRLLARDTENIALLPAVVVRDELRNGELREYAVVPGLFETFYGITVERHFGHPLVRSLLGRDESDLLAVVPPQRRGTGRRNSAG